MVHKLRSVRDALDLLEYLQVAVNFAENKDLAIFIQD